MPQRRYSESEIGEIFERAAAAEAEDPASPALRPGGHTLAELQAIGAEVGFHPHLVAQAARSLDEPDTPVRQTLLGLPLSIGRTYTLERRLTEEEWSHLVADLRATFDASGTALSDGPFRQWANGNLQVLLEPSGGAERLRIRTLKGDARVLTTVGIGMLVAGLLIAAIFLTTDVTGTDWIGPAMLALIGAGMLGTSALQLPGWAATRLEQMEGVAARVQAAIAEGTQPTGTLNEYPRETLGPGEQRGD